MNTTATAVLITGFLSVVASQVAISHAIADSPAAPVKTVDASAAGASGAKPTDCKKYFASVGGMVSVPCER